MFIQMLLMSAVFGGLLAFVGFLFWKANDYGKSWVVLVDQDTGKARVVRQKIKGEGFTIDDKEGGKGKYRVEARARYGTAKGALHILDLRTGWNLRAPSVSELEGRPDNRELIANNPRLYYNAIHTNEIQDTLDSNSGAEPWFAKMAPLAFMALLSILAMLGWLVYQFQKQGQV